MALSEMFARRLRVSAETTRRLVHVWVGIMIFLCPFIFDRPFYPIITAVLFTGINLLALRMEKFKGMHATERTSYGTVYFPVAFIILVLLFWDRAPIALEAGVILLALSDPLAAAVGQRWATSTFTPWRDPKSLPGTAAMLASSIILIALLMVTLYPPATAHGLDWQFIASAIILTALVATVAEGLSWRGSDNLSVPLAAATFLFLFLQLAPTDLAPFLYWSAGSLIVLGAVTAFGALSVSGLAGAWCLGEFIFLAGSWRWLIPIIVFFLLSSALTRLNRSTRYLSHKGGPPAAFGKRNVVQVLANGGMPLLIAVAFGIWGHGLLYLVFLSSLAAATADTWATEIGSWSKRAPRNIITREAMI
ncbi:MAG: DUF92 domain-containing protein, partial [Candidatus Marinimicrobia bacterium]|nr:DUF92 domain-containing protein [Candidatus Neomarinimicrobiota bacterium]